MTSFERPGDNSNELVLDVLPIEQNPHKSVAYIVLCGLNARTVNTDSTTTYEVLYGSGSMEADGEFCDLKPGTIITVPAGMPHQEEGEVCMLATSRPPFDPRQIEYI